MSKPRTSSLQDRDAQFANINASVSSRACRPTAGGIGRDGENAGGEWRPHGNPDAVRARDSLIKPPGLAGLVTKQLGLCVADGP
jgi:hypothetical protein